MAAAAVFTIAMSLGKTTPGSRVRPSFTAGHQSLYASPGKRSGVSVAKKGAGRLLQVEAVGKPLVEYETQLQLFMCNPSAVVEGNDAFRVDEESLVSALALVNGLGQVQNEHGLGYLMHANLYCLLLPQWYFVFII